MGKKLNYKRIIAGTVIGIFSAMLIFAGEGDTVTRAAESFKSQIDAAQKKRDELAAEKKALDEKLNNLKLEKDDLYKYMEELDKEYTELYAEYEANTDEKEVLQAELDITTAEFEYYKALEVSQYEQMKKRVQYMYENGEESFLEVLVGAGSLTELFNQAEYRQQITKYDNNLLNNYKETKEARQNTEQILALQLEQLTLVTELQKQQLDTLEQLSAEKGAEFEAIMAKLEINEELLLDYVQEISAADVNISTLKKKEEERIAEEERKRQEELKKAQSQSIKNIRWPLDANRTVITSYFGWREVPIAGATANHNGIDIGSPTGTNVYAAIAGTVIVASYQGGAGNMIRIDHGNGVTTDYLHGSKLCVSVGDYVQRGQLIMKVGSTGVSTGPHLHFTIKINGTPVNPLNYVKPGQVN